MVGPADWPFPIERGAHIVPKVAIGVLVMPVPTTRRHAGASAARAGFDCNCADAWLPFAGGEADQVVISTFSLTTTVRWPSGAGAKIIASGSLAAEASADQKRPPSADEPQRSANA